MIMLSLRDLTVELHDSHQVIRHLDQVVDPATYLATTGVDTSGRYHEDFFTLTIVVPMRFVDGRFQHAFLKP